MCILLQALRTQELPNEVRHQSWKQREVLSCIANIDMTEQIPNAVTVMLRKVLHQPARLVGQVANLCPSLLQDGCHEAELLLRKAAGADVDDDVSLPPCSDLGYEPGELGKVALVVTRREVQVDERLAQRHVRLPEFTQPGKRSNNCAVLHLD